MVSVEGDGSLLLHTGHDGERQVLQVMKYRADQYDPELLREVHKGIFGSSADFDSEVVSVDGLHKLYNDANAAHTALLSPTEIQSTDPIWNRLQSFRHGGTTVELPPAYLSLAAVVCIDMVAESDDPEELDTTILDDPVLAMWDVVRNDDEMPIGIEEVIRLDLVRATDDEALISSSVTTLIAIKKFIDQRRDSEA